MSLTESSLISKASKILSKSPASIQYCLEAPALGRSIDLVYEKSGKFFAVEFKLTNWQRAIIQAKDYFLACDYSYICMPRKSINKNLLEKAKEAGIGVYALDLSSEKWPFDEILKGKKSKEKWKPAAERVRLYIESERQSES